MRGEREGRDWGKGQVKGVGKGDGEARNPHPHTNPTPHGAHCFHNLRARGVRGERARVKTRSEREGEDGGEDGNEG